MNLGNQKININLLDLPKHLYKISIKKEIIDLVLEDIQIKGKNLYEMLSKLESQKNKKINSIKSTFLVDWKFGHRIPIDCFELLCELSNNGVLDFQKYVCKVFLKSSRNEWNVRFPIELNEDLFLISEAIRTEGNIMKGRDKNNKMQGIVISNKDAHLLKTVEIALNTHNIKSGFSRILVVTIFPNVNKVSKVVNKVNGKNLYFSFNGGKLIFTEQVPNYEVNKEYSIYFENKVENVNIKISDKNLVSIESVLKGKCSIILQVYNSVFANFLSNLFSIPYGIGLEKTYTIDFPFDINLLSDETIKNILNIVISCEGNIFFGREKSDRIIKIKLASKKYLEKIQLMFNRFGIDSKIRKATEEILYILDIRRRKNFERLFDLIKLYSQNKEDILTNIVNSYLKDRMPHFEAKSDYLKILRKLGPTTLKGISNTINRNYDTLIGVYGRLEKDGYVEKYGRKFLGTKTTPWNYKISNKGLKYLTHEHTKK